MPITIKSALMNVRRDDGSYASFDAINASEGHIAPEYDSLVFPVSAGQYCIRQGQLYKAVTAIATSE